MMSHLFCFYLANYLTTSSLTRVADQLTSNCTQRDKLIEDIKLPGNLVYFKAIQCRRDYLTQTKSTIYPEVIKQIYFYVHVRLASDKARQSPLLNTLLQINLKSTQVQLTFVKVPNFILNNLKQVQANIYTCC